tara:strand:- start:2263 stop:2706 length:444 start_codon:yes stop_codon:yes gene_type:complete
MNQSFTIHNLENHITKDINDSHTNGELTVVWRNWDKKFNDPEMVYVNKIKSKEVKGPHIHQNRTSYFYCIQGEIILIIKDQKGEFHEIKVNADQAQLIEVPNGVAAALLNPTENTTIVLVLADIAWRPNDNEMKNVTFEDYNWDKWK